MMSLHNEDNMKVGPINSDYTRGYLDGKNAGASAEAEKAQQEIKELTQWKKDTSALLNPLLDWGQCQKDFPLGKSITTEILRRAKEYKELKERADKLAKEHSDLNLALAAMLNGYQNLSMDQKDWFAVPKDLIDHYTKMVLEYDLQGKEVRGGD